jgi:YD repeat-containing protein
VNVSGNTVGYVTTLHWRNQRGEILKTKENESVMRKYQYDGAGRVTRATISHDASESGYAAAVDPTLADDTVVTQIESIYDKNGNVITSKRLDRVPGYTGTGPLPHGDARGSYEAMWYDKENRGTHHAHYGNNGDQNFVRPTDPPQASDPNQVLLTLTGYTPLGDVASGTDPKGLSTSYTYDGLGRLIQRIESEGEGPPWSDRITDYTYTPTDLIKTITASTAGANPGESPQTTTYFYGVVPGQDGSAIASNRLPEPSWGPALPWNTSTSFPITFLLPMTLIDSV